MFTSFRLDEVRLTDDAFASRRELVKAYIRDFDLERLLHTFKLNAGIPSDAAPLGGWEAPDCGLRGHFVGHFLSACAKFAYGDGDETLKAKAGEIVDVLARCARPNGYLSAFEEEKLDVLELEEDRNVWAPYYTLHKILQGLIDCNIYLRNAKALDLAVNLAIYVQGRFERLSNWKIDGILRCTKVNPVNEFGGIGDSLYSLYDGIGGEERYKKAALHFYDFVKGRTFANGNNSSRATACIRGGVSEKAENWGGYGRLEDALTGGESESCCAHNTERIVERLLEWSGEVEYLEHLESLKYNAVLNSASAKTGLSQYHQPMGRQALKKFSEPYDSFWCCTASGIDAMSELQKNVWFRNGDAVLLNAFISSTAAWKDRGIRIVQRTDFPDSLASALFIEAEEPAVLRILFREAAVRSVKVNSEAIELRREGGFVSIERLFRDGDRIDVEIEAPLHLVSLPGSDALSALMYGNVLLAGVGDDRPLKGLSQRNLLEKLASRRIDGRVEFYFEDEEAARPDSFRCSESRSNLTPCTGIGPEIRHLIAASPSPRTEAPPMKARHGSLRFPLWKQRASIEIPMCVVRLRYRIPRRREVPP
ncbi:beta-L-arabinofuranosidase domain-containing protein [Cohnella sp. LGH]|uniref:beta-L-arabinofuranosidase domain-containing protein n=1 Tax=Cohnella sp. LGH TaxID=1619153 RepID=UPI001FFE0D1E|nr:beta-L-arabinofuranosidase domain-containing protein [Cohnella sp. LGH]